MMMMIVLDIPPTQWSSDSFGMVKSSCLSFGTNDTLLSTPDPCSVGTTRATAPGCKAAGCGEQGPGKEAFDCNAALGNWCRAWSPSKKVWCCNNQQRPDGTWVETLRIRGDVGRSVSGIMRYLWYLWCQWHVDNMFMLCDAKSMLLHELTCLGWGFELFEWWLSLLLMVGRPRVRVL